MSVFAWIGGICSIGLLILFINLSFGYACEQLCGLWDRFKWAYRIEFARDVGNLILRESYWFSETEDGKAALDALGEALKEHGMFNPSDVRDDYRRRKPKLSAEGEK